MELIYYKNQNNWTINDFNYLHRYLSKMVENYQTTVGSIDGKKRIYEIKNIDISKLSDATKNILYCIIYTQNKKLLLLKNIKNITPVPFDEKFFLVRFKLESTINVYRNLNIVY